MENRIIHLTQGKCTLVDAKNYDWLNSFKWYYDSAGYAARSRYLGGGAKNRKYEHVLMSRWVLGLEKEDKQECDHINGNKLDNCEINLRTCTHAQNMQNSISKVGTSKYKGVSFHKRDRVYRAYIWYNKALHHLGSFKNERVAALIYDLNARKHFGEFANCNF